MKYSLMALHVLAFLYGCDASLLESLTNKLI